MTEQKKTEPVEATEAPELTLYDAFCIKHMDRLNMWMAHHKAHQKFPIEFHDQYGFVWLNRKARRARK